MQHNLVSLIQSQVKVLKDGKRVLQIQVKIDSYSVIENVARDRGEPVDDVIIGVILNNEGNSEIDVEEVYEDGTSDSQSIKVRDLGCKQLYVTIRSRVLTVYSNMIKYISNTKEKKVSKDLEVDDFDFLEMPGKSKEYLNKLKKSDDKFDNLEKWTANQFGTYMRDKFKERYGTNSFEFVSFEGKPSSHSAKGREWTIIKRNLINVFIKGGFTNAHVVEYINWMFDEKSHSVKFPLNLGFVCSKALITEWRVHEQDNVNKATRKETELQYDTD